MRCKIETGVLQKMVQRVNPGVGNSKILPVTQYLEVKVQDGELFLTSTNASSFMCANSLVGDWEEGSVLVKADTFIKLIQRTKTDEVRLTSNSNQLSVHGHGIYKQALYRDREFPEWEQESLEDLGVIKGKTLKERLKVHEAAVSNTMVRPEMTGYYIGGDKMVTTDDTRLCVSEIGGVSSVPMLIPGALAELLYEFDDEDDVRVLRSERALEFHSEGLKVRGPELLGLDRFPNTEAIESIEYENNWKVAVAKFQDAVDRVSLFSDPYYSYGVVISVEGNSVYVTDLLNQTRELVTGEGLLEKDVKLVLNSQHLLGVLSKFSRESDMLFEWNKEEDPVRVGVEGGEELFYLTTVEVNS